MKTYKFYNVVTGWIVFAIATITYFLTIEPTTSLWDCGEFIASAYKLEVGHPPGAPLFMIIARVASMLSFGDVTIAAKMINGLSALASSFTILFLFWSITHLAKKLIIQLYYVKEKVVAGKVLGITTYKNILVQPESEIKLTAYQTILILLSGAVGALAYTFSDTFWFSAVEAEVYALSSLFTAVVFWAILKWENDADKKFANRWLILIAYLMGLSIGVHLLNLLAIPAIVFVYYFKKYPPTSVGFLSALAVSIAILGAVMYIIIPGLVQLAAGFELFFTNSLGMPFNTGIIFYALTVLGGLSFGIYYSHKKGKVILNTIFISVLVIIIGYSSYAMTVIRSAANPPMDENNPENVFNLLSYLNREQYGDRPLLYGQYYNAEVVAQEKEYTYMPEGDKYVKIAKANPKYIYDSKFKGFFPRMHSSNGGHVQAYKSWATIKDDDGKIPSFSDNIEFFVKYQIGHMYFRYFMWNFSGRQNDMQGHGGYQEGNWITGIGLFDSMRLGSQSDLPDSMKNHHARNTYYLLPLLLGFFGFFLASSVQRKDFFVVTLLFVLTGLAIVIYLNQTPYQPRERDYAYAGSFYAFAIWIGLGVISVFEFVRKNAKNSTAALAVSALTLVIPVQMAVQNWDDHDRSGRYTARDFAISYLESCAPNAILFTFGDNDTFPLWYAQEVEGIRTDIRVVNLSLLGTDWYIEQMRKRAYNSPSVPFSMGTDKYLQSKRNIAPVYQQNEFLLQEKFAANRSLFQKEYEQLYQQFMPILQNSRFPELQKSDYDKISSGHTSINALQFIGLVNALASKENSSKYFTNANALDSVKAKSDVLLQNIANSHVPLKAIVDFIASDDPATKVRPASNEEMDFIPTKKFLLPVNKEKCIANGDIDPSDKNNILNNIRWEITRSYFLKNDIAVLDILATNNWERPVYFATSMSADEYLGLQDYFRLEGMAYRLVPYKTKNEDGMMGDINTSILYDNVMNKFKWGRMAEPDVLIEAYNLRQIGIMEIRTLFIRLAYELIEEKDNTKAKEVLDKCIALTPHEKVTFDQTVLPIVEAYYAIGDTAKATEISNTMLTHYDQVLGYYTKLSGSYASDVSNDKDLAMAIVGKLMGLAQQNNNTELLTRIYGVYTKYAPAEIKQ